MRSIVPATVLICLWAAFVPGAASAHDEGLGFLEFSAGHSIQADSKAVKVSVGLIEDENENPTGAVWFFGQIQSPAWTRPQKFRWTDSDRCPAVMPILRGVRNISMPKAVLPLPDPEGFEDRQFLIMDGRNYELHVSSSTLDGQLTSEFSMSSNIGSELAVWVEEMLDELDKCWSTTVPEGMSIDAGTKGYADANR